MPRPFWCTAYQEKSGLAGWVSINVILPSGLSGGMTSPIEACQVSATDWSVMASGTERDGVDRTTMAFKIAGTYHGPRYYKGSLAQGISGSFSHSDLGTQVYSSVATSDCDFCINEDGRSGTVKCWDLEATVGTSTAFAYIDFGQFTCPSALPKPADQPTVPPKTSGVGGIPTGAVVCHYLEKLGCPGRVDYETCVKNSDHEVLNGTCYGPWETWLTCVNTQSPSRRTSAEINLSVVLVEHGMMYLVHPSEKGAVEVVGIQTRSPGLADSSWPSLRHDNRGTAWLVPGVPSSAPADPAP